MSMEPMRLYYTDFDIREEIGQMPKLRIMMSLRANNISQPHGETWLQMNRISFDVDLHIARDHGSYYEQGHIGYFESRTPVTVMEGLTVPLDFLIPLNQSLINTILHTRDLEYGLALKIHTDLTGINYWRRGGSCQVLNIWQSQGVVYQATSQGDVNLVLISSETLQQILDKIKYTELLRLDIPIYSENASINPVLKSATLLLKHAGLNLRDDRNDGVFSDVRKALTDHLIAEKNAHGERMLNPNLAREILDKSPVEARPIAQDVLNRIQEGLRAVLKITDKFAHDDKTVTMPLRKDAEYVYFSTCLIVANMINRLQN